MFGPEAALIASQRYRPRSLSTQELLAYAQAEDVAWSSLQALSGPRVGRRGAVRSLATVGPTAPSLREGGPPAAVPRECRPAAGPAGRASKY